MSPDRPEPPRPEEPPDPGVDIDATFADIVSHFGETGVAAGEPPDLEGPDLEALEPPAPSGPSVPPVVSRSLFEPVWDDPLDTPATWEDEGHFIPPNPPPLPPGDPRRRVAWTALFGAPVAMLLLVLLSTVLGWYLPTWVTGVLTAAFIGSFGYLVATMGSGDDRGGDDGAVV